MNPMPRIYFKLRCTGPELVEVEVGLGWDPVDEADNVLARLLAHKCHRTLPKC